MRLVNSFINNYAPVDLIGNTPRKIIMLTSADIHWNSETHFNIYTILWK